MKDIGIYCGTGSFTILTKLVLGDLGGFNFIQNCFIFFFFLAVAIFGGFVGMAIQDSLNSKGKRKWNGRRKDLRQYLAVSFFF